MRDLNLENWYVTKLLTALSRQVISPTIASCRKGGLEELKKILEEAQELPSEKDREEIVKRVADIREIINQFNDCH